VFCDCLIRSTVLAVVCVDVQLFEPRQIKIACPSSSTYIDSVEFASVGQPQGGCELPVASHCHSDSFSALLGDRCVGRNNCTVHSQDLLANANLSCSRALRALALVRCAESTAQAVFTHTIDHAADPAPTNTFTYFRAAIKLPETRSDLFIDVAADSNAAVFVDGKLLSRKLTRYKESFITADRYIVPKEATSHGLTTFVFRHFSWGNVETFQRTGETVCACACVCACVCACLSVSLDGSNKIQSLQTNDLHQLACSFFLHPPL
jgi:hypothetical protein